MSVEIECKVAVDSHAGLADKLRAAGAEYLGRVLETNRLFDNTARTLLQRGCGLRVRSLHVLDGHSDGASATMTFKGPVKAGSFKQREEIELPIADADADAMSRLLAQLGYTPWLTFEKRRESWRLSPDGGVAACNIELDELPVLGCFVEIEGPNEAAIRQAASRIGVDPAESITQSYAGLIAAQCGEVPMTLKFPES